FSNISSDDSDYTRRKKKGKSVVDSVTKNLIAEKESVDLEQAIIQSNYVDLSNKSQDPEEFLSESELYESGIELDISEDKLKNTKKRKHIDDNISKNFEQKNKDNLEFKRLKRLFKGKDTPKDMFDPLNGTPKSLDISSPLQIHRLIFQEKRANSSYRETLPDSTTQRAIPATLIIIFGKNRTRIHNYVLIGFLKESKKLTNSPVPMLYEDERTQIRFSEFL
ncbi:23458_t:CDS:2, partial [Dentiscutata erythropus]